MTAQPVRLSNLSAPQITTIGLLVAAGLWAYWSTLMSIAGRWESDPQYSHGYLVPVFALFLLWTRREGIQAQALKVNVLGLALLGIAVALRLGGAYTAYEYFDHVSLLPCCAGLFLLMGGWPAFVWSLPAVAFLAFMIPLPDRISLALSGPMQALATTASTFVLQVLGRPAIAETNVILLNDIELGIVEACSGLRMLVVFFALSTAVALLVRKPLWEKLLIAASAVPIALVSNILRITITGLFYDTFGNHFGGALFHDLAGWLMMPLGLAFLGIELWILKTLLIERPSESGQSQVALHRVEVSPVLLYGEAQAPRRPKDASPEPEPQLVE